MPEEGMRLIRWRGLIVIVSLLGTWPAQQGAGWAAELSPQARAAPAPPAADRAGRELPGAESEETLVIAEVEIAGQRESFEVDPTRSRTTVTAKELERRQSSNVFTVLQDVAGVSVNGGPLAGGMSFNIRGAGDTEDVLIKVDGAVRNFEKYRFGSGVFIEPELLKAVEVTRGPAGALQGSGAIGGAVEMQTKDAADLLRPGERAGARFKGGFSSNNEEKMGSASAYGAAFGALDLLANVTWRGSDNVRTAGGDELQNTKTDRYSGLAKATYSSRPGARISFAEMYSQESTLQPFDATIGVPGVFGFVRRAVTDSTSTANFDYTPEAPFFSSWINLKGTLGYTTTSVTDSDKQDAKGVLIPNSPTNFFDYAITTINLTNTSRFRLGPLRTATTYGIQYNHNSREAKTNQFHPTQGRVTVDNLSQPSGDKSYLAYMAEHRVEIGDLSAFGALRHDTYKVEVTAQETRNLLGAEGRSPQIAFAKAMPSAGIAWTILGGPVTLFYNYIEAFRPPLLDEYFMQGAFGRCPSFLFGALAPVSGVCGTYYAPERSRNQEIGLSLRYPGLIQHGDTLNAKLTFFRNRVERTLESLSARAASGALCTPLNPAGGNNVCTHVTQDGKERLEGLEFELGYQSERWFSNVSMTAMRGKQVCDGERDLYDIPGNTVVFTLGRNDVEHRLEYGYRIRAVGERRVITGGQPVSSCNIGLTIGTQAGYVTHNLFAAYQMTDSLNLNLTVDNFTNTRYFLNNGFGGSIGQEAPGYNIRFSMSMVF